MNSIETAIPLFLGVLVAAALGLTVTLVWYSVYMLVYMRRIFVYSIFAKDDQISIYLTWIAASLIATVGDLLSFGTSIGKTLSDKVFSRLPLIIGLILLSFAAMAWTEYHDVYIARAMDVYQCVVTWLFYDMRLMSLVNIGRLVYDVLWPVARFVARMTRFLLRTLPIIVADCAKDEILGGLADISNGLVLSAQSLGNWTSGPGGIPNTTIDVTLPATFVTKGLERILMTSGVCVCESTDFVPAIVFGWIDHFSTVAIINSTTVLAADVFIKIPLRTLTGTNPGTIPGVTSDYGYVPNIDIILDDLCDILRSLMDFTNHIVYLLVKELVGIFDDTIFVPGSPESVRLMTDWLGFVGHIGCAVIELYRWAFHVEYSILFLVIQLIALAIESITMSDINAAVPVLCDLREWRALYDFGGKSGLYRKDGGIAGELNLAMDALSDLLDDITHPIVRKLVVPVWRIEFNLVFGTLNAVMRGITHGIDSEFRMFTPSIPPRTGLPATTWIPPPVLSPPVLDCDVATFVPGNYWVWIEHMVNDPEGVHRLVIDVNFGEIAEGLDELGSLILPAFGQFLSNLIRLPTYLYDFYMQFILGINVILTEPPTNYALFLSRWRFQRYLDTYSNLGDGLGDTIRALHPVPCTGPSDGFFCGLGNVADHTLALFDEIGVQIMLVFSTTRLEDIQLPNLSVFIQNLEDALVGYYAVLFVWVPPIPMSATFTLYDTVTDLAITVPRAAIIILSVPNYAIAHFQVPLDEMKMGSTFGVILDALIDYFKDVLAFAFSEITNRLCSTSPQSFIPAYGEFLSRITGLPFFGPIATAFCLILDVVQTFFNDFALELIGLVLTVLARFLDIFFNSDTGTFGSRIESFFLSLGALIAHIFFTLPLFIFELFFGLIEAILPPPLGAIFSAVSMAIINGLCTIIQFFVTTVIDIINFFGANLSPIDLHCGGKKRDMDDMDQYRKALVQMVVNSYQSNDYIRDRIDRIRATVQRKRTVHMPNQDSTVVIMDDILHANVTAYESASSLPPISMGMDEALQMVAEYADWNGGSFCDQIVVNLAGSGRSAASLSILEHAHYADCISKRALGEIVNILPYLHWFPRDGFYNPMAWLTLGADGVYAYRIYSQYESDRSMPKETVLSDAYRASWADHSLRVDHLTYENYHAVIFNMTVKDYFVRNHGNYEILRGIQGLLNATLDSARGINTYLSTISATADLFEKGSIDAWLYTDDTLSDEIQMRQQMWRGILRIVQGAYNASAAVVSIVSDHNVTSNLYGIVAETPRLVVQAVAWATSEPTDEWREAVRVRDEILTHHGLYLNITDGRAASGIFGVFTPASLGARLRAWASNKLTSALSHLRPNSPRARRNWAVIAQLGADISNGMQHGFLPDRYGTRAYTPQHVSAGNVSVLATCDTTLVPFCLDCAVLDGGLNELVVGAIEFMDYWRDDYPLSNARYLSAQNYIENDTVNVCNGDGTTEIHWPSNLELVGTTTFFNVFGNNNGAISNLIAFLKAQFSPLIQSMSKDRFYAGIRHYLLLRGASHGTGRVRASATPDYITDYALTHTEFDPTYAITAFADITVVTSVMDDFHGFLDEIEFGLDPQTFGNGTFTVPVLRTNSTGFLSDLFNSFISANYTHSCADRNMSLKQGLFIMTGIVVVVFFVAKALGESMLPQSIATMLTVGVLMIAIPFMFPMIVYGTPLQNLFFLPVPIPAPCLADDVLELVICDAVPKCPAIVAGLVRGTYTEANCHTCPFEPDLINCKHDYDIRHGLDTMLLLLEWLSPVFMNGIRGNNGGLLATSLSLVGIDLTRYQGIDFSDKTTFDALLSCLFVMTLPTLPILALGLIIFEVTMSIAIGLVSAVAGNMATTALAVYMLFSHIAQLLTYNLIYVVAPGERSTFYDAIRAAHGRRSSVGIRIPHKRTTIVSALRYMYNDLGIEHMVSGRTFMGPLTTVTKKKKKKNHRHRGNKNKGHVD